MDWCVKGRRRKVWRAPERSTEGAGRISWSVPAPNQETEQSIALASEGSQFREMCANMPGNLSRVPVGKDWISNWRKRLSLEVWRSHLHKEHSFTLEGLFTAESEKGCGGNRDVNFPKWCWAFFPGYSSCPQHCTSDIAPCAIKQGGFFFGFEVCFCVFVRRKYTVYKVNQDLLEKVPCQ